MEISDKFFISTFVIIWHKKLLGYFNLAIKPLTVKGETVSNTTKRKLLRISELDEKSDTYTMSAYLIAQLGKNYAGGINKKITGKEQSMRFFTLEIPSCEICRAVFFCEKRKKYGRCKNRKTKSKRDALANMLQQELRDGRFSENNKAWASEFSIPENIVREWM